MSLITSKNVEPFTRIPFLAALPIPAKYPKGMLNTNAHGHDITRSTIALYSHSENNCPKNNGGIAATKTASITTAGV